MKNKDAYIDALKFPIGFYLIFFVIGIPINYIIYKDVDAQNPSTAISIFSTIFSCVSFVAAVCLTGYAGWRIVVKSRLDLINSAITGFFIAVFKILMMPISWGVSYLTLSDYYGSTFEPLKGLGGEESSFVVMFMILVLCLSFVMVICLEVGVSFIGGLIGKSKIEAKI